MFRNVATTLGRPAAAASAATAQVLDENVSLEALMLETSEEIGESMAAFEAYDDTLDHLEHLHASIESHGLSSALVAFADRDALLSSTVLNFPSVESMAGLESFTNTGASSAEAIAACEGIVDTIKEKVTGWAKAAWSAVTGLAEKAGNLVKAAWGKVVEFATWVKNKTFDAAKAAKETIQAHPYASAAAAVAALTAIGTIVASIIWPGSVPATAGAFAGYVKKVGSALKGLVIPNTTVDFNEAGDVVFKKNAAEKVKSGTIKALGYSGDKIKELATKAADALKAGGGALGKAISGLRTHAGSAISSVKGGGEKAAEAAKWARKTVGVAIRATWKLISGGVMGILRSIMGTFSSLKKAFTGEKGAPLGEPAV